ncbi:MAG: TolC family protein [Ignavibacteriaceae bacterium]|nr:TolC family protein [Ignavibacteriaceae bacterium]
MKKRFVFFAVVLIQFCIYGQSERKNLSLNDAIELGIKNNQEIKSAVENISAAKGKFWSGISLPQPELGISYEYVPVNNSLKNFGERSVEISQSFEFPSNYFLKANKFIKGEEIAVNELTFTQRKVISKIKTGYYKVLAKQNQLKYAAENLEISEDFYKKAEIKYAVGVGSNLEKLTAKVQFTEVLNNLETVKNELTNANSEFIFALGLDTKSDNSGYELVDSLVFVDHQLTLENLLQSLEVTNAEIIAAGLNNDVASVEKSLAWSSLLPNFNLAYFKQTLGADNGFYGASFGVSVPLWFFMDQRGKILEADANQSISESEFQLTKNEIALMVKNAFINHENNMKQVRLYLNEILPLAEEIYRTAERSYDAGELTYIEYLQAKQTLISSRNNYINALYNHYQSDFILEELTGQNNFDKTELEN